MKSLVTPGYFSHFIGEYSIFLSDIFFVFKLRMQTWFQINLLPFFIAYIRKYTEMD